MVLSGTPAHLACLLQCFLPNFFPLSLPPTSPPPPLPLIPPAHSASSFFPLVPLFSDASRSSTNSPCELLESVQYFRVSSRCHQQPVPNFRAIPNATSSPCQMFEPVQDATSSPCQIFESVQYSQSNATAANLRVSPRPLRTAPTKADRRAISGSGAVLGRVLLIGQNQPY